MALFFDQNWFNEQLDRAGLTKADLAQSLGLTAAELDAMWKDQREIHEREIGTMALLLGVPEAEVRKRGGIQGSPEARAALRAQRTPAPAPRPAPPGDIEARLAALEDRLAALEARLKK
jgi:uncharacterized protein YceH (UPF0502 family)